MTRSHVAAAIAAGVALAASGCFVAADLTGKACDAQHACDGALLCVDGRCTDEAPLDAGRDDGGREADGGHDDAGATDAGRIDAGALDGGGVDGGGASDGGDGGADGGGASDGGDDAGGPDAPVCGDGRVTAGEACDDGDSLDGNGCSSACDVEPDVSCLGAPSVCLLTSAVTFICSDADAGCLPRLPSVITDGTYFVRAGTYHHDALLDLHDVDVVIVGEPGAVIVGTSGTSLVFVDGNMAQGLRLQGLTLAGVGTTVPLVVAQAADVVVEDCTIGPAGTVGILQSGAASKLVVSRSVVAGNLAGGLELLAGDALVESTFIVDNGLGTSFGGAHLAGAGQKRLVLVTIAGNRADEATGAAGVLCEPGDPSVNDLVGALVWGNGSGVQLSGCSIRVSHAEGVATQDPLFVDAAGGDHHLQPGSPLVDMLATGTLDAELRASGLDAGVAALGPRDVDGQPRSVGSGYDVGADELP